MQLPFAVIPLIKFTSDKSKMGIFANKTWVKILAWVTATIIVGLNANLVFGTISGWIENAGDQAIWLWITVVPIAIGCALLLVYISLPKVFRMKKKIVPEFPVPVVLAPQHYSKIGVSIDYGRLDSKVLSHALSLAMPNKAALYLFHIVEGVSGQIYGDEAYDNEAREDQKQLELIAGQLRSSGLEVHAVLGYGTVPKQLIKLSTDNKVELLVMGGHRHRGLKDIFLGTSISQVRHALSIPVLIVQ
jgi:manganese transport protein